jgi:hypothetical protein
MSCSLRAAQAVLMVERGGMRGLKAAPLHGHGPDS